MLTYFATFDFIQLVSTIVCVIVLFVVSLIMKHVHKTDAYRATFDGNNYIKAAKRSKAATIIAFLSMLLVFIFGWPVLAFEFVIGVILLFFWLIIGR